MKRSIIVVEDEADLANLISLRMSRSGYEVSTYADGNEGWNAIERGVPDLVLLDLMLPGLDGLEICRRIRSDDRLKATQVVMVTALGQEADIVKGLELGADDYVTKPFSPRVLEARVHAVLRRAGTQEPVGTLVRLGPIEIDDTRHEVRVNGRKIEPTHTEYKILRFLCSRPGRVRTRADILRAMGEAIVLDRTVDVHVASLRKKLGEAAARIETVRGVGYRAKDQS